MIVKKSFMAQKRIFRHSRKSIIDMKFDKLNCSFAVTTGKQSGNYAYVIKS